MRSSPSERGRRPPLVHIVFLHDVHVHMSAPSSSWVVVTGGGGGIGRALVHHFSSTRNVLTCGRRLGPLNETVATAPRPGAIAAVACDIGTSEGRALLLRSLPESVAVTLLVHNAAIGNPGRIDQLDVHHFEASLQVNVVAPLALSQALIPRLRASEGRILHLGTSVAFHPQPGTATYGITKMAFHRLYQQLNAESTGVCVGSISPGMVDTEGVQDHVAKARALGLPHVAFFDQAYANGWTTPLPQLMRFVDEVLQMDGEAFGAQEWRFSEWHTQQQGQQGTSYAAYEKARRGNATANTAAEPRGAAAVVAALVAGFAAGAVVATSMLKRS